MFDSVIAVLDWFGIGVFATTGALVASRKQLDIVSFALLGTVTGVGGGTLRDLLLGVSPVFWVRDPTIVVVCVAVSVLVFFVAHIPESRYRLLLWFDAAGLALFAVVGAEKGLEAGSGPVIAVLMGVITASFGGIIRDVVGDEPSILLRPEIYLTAALAASLLFVALTGLGVPRTAAIIAGVGIGFAIRGGALLKGWALPVYRARPGRTPDQLGL
ncbi:MAG: trimeric intracellular cation channel family protein [Azospirillum sp.]|nr:trimeric intracellular cation channel family protein [Azospirillum sp.]